MKWIICMTLCVLLAGSAVCDAAVWCRDADLDGYGDRHSTVTALIAPPFYVANGWDCDDNNALVNPASPEICGNAVDEDCDLLVDNGCTVWVLDVDGDGWGNNATAVASPTSPPGYMGKGGDCDDSDHQVRPQGTEICGDLLDNDCDTVIDTGCNLWYLDQDQDGYGVTSQFQSSVLQPVGYALTGGDCHDSNAQVHPGATEICGNGVDEDCNGVVDDCAVGADRPSWGGLKGQYR